MPSNGGPRRAVRERMAYRQGFMDAVAAIKERFESEAEQEVVQARLKAAGLWTPDAVPSGDLPIIGQGQKDETYEGDEFKYADDVVAGTMKLGPHVTEDIEEHMPLD